MDYRAQWDSPLGKLTVTSNGSQITGLWMEGQQYFGAGMAEHCQDGSGLPVMTAIKKMLDEYFRGVPVDFSLLPIQPQGTPFQEAVWEQLRRIPWGETRTYGQLAAALEATTGRRTSPRAVGTAVGRNPVSILIPCHRVLGSQGTLTGYAGGLERKEFLLKLESAARPL